MLISEFSICARNLMYNKNCEIGDIDNKMNTVLIELPDRHLENFLPLFFSYAQQLGYLLAKLFICTGHLPYIILTLLRRI